ncbi:hypothetical protein [Pantoea sp. AS142]|uniref:hypothetical protein n=1 Tax=Pantoea sp. AS142 TaxID=3081292 RepID=UPI00301AFC1B
MDFSLPVNREKIQPETVYPCALNPYPTRPAFPPVHDLSFFQAPQNEIIALRQWTRLMLPAFLPLPLLADNDNTLLVTAAPP